MLSILFVSFNGLNIQKCFFVDLSFNLYLSTHFVVYNTFNIALYTNMELQVLKLTLSRISLQNSPLGNHVIYHVQVNSNYLLIQKTVSVTLGRWFRPKGIVLRATTVWLKFFDERLFLKKKSKTNSYFEDKCVVTSQA